jgi:8-oxo-dGTP diphosphatase
MTKCKCGVGEVFYSHLHAPDCPCASDESLKAPLSRPAVGVGVFIWKDNKFLLGKRKGGRGAGEWSLPGGHLEGGESFEDACRREVMEEVGIKICSIRKLTFSNDIFPNDKHYVTLFFHSDYHAGEVRNMEPDKCDGWEWHTAESAPRPLFRPLETLFSNGFLPYRFSEAWIETRK